MLISPTEPDKLKALGEVSGAPERYGCDVLFTTGNQLTGVQRKKFPEDLMASLSDGRLTTQLPKMEKLDRRLIVLEGYGEWTIDGELAGQYRFTKHQMFGLVFSLAFEFGIEVVRVRDMAETIDLLEEMEVWASKDKHLSLLSRPGAKKDGWGKATKRAVDMHVLTGFPSIGPGTAEAMLEHFGGLPLKWTVEDAKALQAVPGIGKGRAKALWEALDE